MLTTKSEVISLPYGKDFVSDIISWKGKKMFTSTISSKGQVTIPKKIREFLKVGHSDKIVFIPLEDGKVLITSERISAKAIFGMLKHKKPKTPVSLEDMEAVIKQKRTERGSR